MFFQAEAYVLMDYLVNYELYGYIWFWLLAQKQIPILFEASL